MLLDDSIVIKRFSIPSSLTAQCVLDRMRDEIGVFYRPISQKSWRSAHNFGTAKAMILSKIV
jgi:hypothetical protein